MVSGGRAFGAAAALIVGWAMLGGMVLLAVVAMNAISVLATVAGRTFPGDFELTQLGVAIAAFAFLPYCQLTNANVAADIFTSRASPRALSIFRLAASAAALLFSGLLVWRMFLGMSDQREYGYTTAILQIPVWWAFVPILASLALLVVASYITLSANFRAAIRGCADHD